MKLHVTDDLLEFLCKVVDEHELLTAAENRAINYMACCVLMSAQRTLDNAYPAGTDMHPDELIIRNDLEQRIHELVYPSRGQHISYAQVKRDDYMLKQERGEALEPEEQDEYRMLEEFYQRVASKREKPKLVLLEGGKP